MIGSALYHCQVTHTRRSGPAHRLRYRVAYFLLDIDALPDLNRRLRLFGVDRPGLREPRFLAPVLGTFMWALPHTLRQTRAAEGTSLAVAVPGGTGGAWCVRRERGAWHLYAGAPDNAAARVSIDPDAAWRLCTRGLSREEAEELVIVEGDLDLGARVLEMISIIA